MTGGMMQGYDCCLWGDRVVHGGLRFALSPPYGLLILNIKQPRRR
jgi:hypothetical protein